MRRCGLWLTKKDERCEGGVDGFLAGPGESDGEALAGFALVRCGLDCQDGAGAPFGLARVLELIVWLE